MTEDEFRKGGLPDMPAIIAELKGLLIKHLPATPEDLEGLNLAGVLSLIDRELQGANDSYPVIDECKPLHDQLALLRQHTVALYETLTSTSFGAGNEGTPTEAILGHLATTARALLDGNDALRRAAVNEAVTLRYRLDTLSKRSDRVIRHLGEAISLYATEPGEEFDGPSNRDEGRTPPPA